MILTYREIADIIYKALEAKTVEEKNCILIELWRNCKNTAKEAV